MVILLKEYERVSFAKEAPSLKNLLIGLGWDPRATDGEEFDLDGSAILVGKDDKVKSDAYFVFYNQTSEPEGAVKHLGDSLTGEGEGDDEEIVLELAKISPDVEKIKFVVSIYDADNRKQAFGQVDNAFIRLVDNDTNKEIARFDLSEDGGSNTAVIFGEVYRKGDGWSFKAVGDGWKDGLSGVARAFGVNA